LTVTAASKNEETSAIPSDGSLVQPFRDGHVEKLRADPQKTITAGNSKLKISFSPLHIVVMNQRDEVIQEFTWDEHTGVLSFPIGTSPLFGLGEGGQQFGRRGSIDMMRGQEEVSFSRH
jgi:alpha-glucosidase/alpha-D-xyloside xylohydrolase